MLVWEMKPTSAIFGQPVTPSVKVSVTLRVNLTVDAKSGHLGVHPSLVGGQATQKCDVKYIAKKKKDGFMKVWYLGFRSVIIQR